MPAVNDKSGRWDRAVSKARSIISVIAALNPLFALTAVAIATLAYCSDLNTRRDDVEQQRQLERRSNALGYVSDFRTGSIHDARETILRQFKTSGLTDQSGTRITPELLQETIDRLLEADVTGLELYSAVASIAAFLDSVGACIKAAVCDEQIVREQIAPYARNFRAAFGLTIETIGRENGEPSFGTGTARVAALFTGTE